MTFTPNAGAGPSRLFDRSCTEERETSSMLDHVLRGLIARPEPDVGLVVAGVELPAAQVVALRSAAVRPADAVLGLDVPARFGAVVATAPSLLRRSTRAHSDGVLGVAVARNGVQLCLLACDDQIVAAHVPRGWLVDACQRSLGLATPPPDMAAVDLALALWLDRLLVDLSQGRICTWADAVLRCPLRLPPGSLDPDAIGQRLDREMLTWPGLRRAGVAGDPLPVPISPADAAWMDDGMFSRWTLGFFPDLDDLRSDIEFLAPPGVADAIARVVHAAHRSFQAR